METTLVTQVSPQPHQRRVSGVVGWVLGWRLEVTSKDTERWTVPGESERRRVVDKRHQRPTSSPLSSSSGECHKTPCGKRHQRRSLSFPCVVCTRLGSPRTVLCCPMCVTQCVAEPGGKVRVSTRKAVRAHNEHFGTDEHET
ncbi:protein containing flavodoxin-like fold domain protein [Anopheles sinensis]|uniref:Protein containing flavodoxin-like fold domain protein n=1 Tax=Anopheles sinensis TaxID=74873 RepID=A0A084WRB6_ANOSI|nr:protein containing flavodoxin-like fold domain protein [Anopheles sinensis]